MSNSTDNLSAVEKERQRLEKFPHVEDDSNPSVSGVLLSDQIQNYVKSFRMIEPFDE